MRSKFMACLAAVLAGLLYGSSASAHGVEHTFRHELKTEHFLIHYDTTGTHATTEAFAQRVGEESEEILAQFRKHGFKDPWGKPPWKINLLALGEGALGTASGPPREELSIGINILLEKEERTRASSWSVIAHELFHGIQYAYVPRLNELPLYVIEGTPNAVAYTIAPSQKRRDEVLKSAIGPYMSTGRKAPLTGQAHGAAAYWSMIADQAGGAAFFRQLFEGLVDYEISELVPKLTQQSEINLFHAAALRLYGEATWKAEEASGLRWGKYDLQFSSAELRQQLRAGQKVALKQDSQGFRLSVRPYTIGAIGIAKEWGLQGRTRLTVSAADDAVVYVLVGTGKAAQLSDYQAVRTHPGLPVVIDAGAAQVSVLVLRSSASGSAAYSLALEPNVSEEASALVPLEELMQTLFKPTLSSVPIAGDYGTLQAALEQVRARAGRLEEAAAGAETARSEAEAKAQALEKRLAILTDSSVARVDLKLGEAFIWVDGVQKPLETPPVLIEGRTHLPVRALAEALGAGVTYDSATERIGLDFSKGPAGRLVFRGRSPVTFRDLSWPPGYRWDESVGKLYAPDGRVVTREEMSVLLKQILNGR
jgi:hypothetical protein